MALTTQTRRVKVLEDGGGGSGRPPCDYCGWGGDNGEPDDYDDGDTFEIVFDDSEAEEDEFCPECGRRVNVVVRFEEDLS